MGTQSPASELAIQDELRALVDRYGDSLPSFPWASEEDRWAELVFCILNSLMSDSPPRVRSAVAGLRALGLLNPEKLASAGDVTDEHHVVVRYVLTQYGFAEAEAVRAAHVLSGVATVVNAEFGGRMQRYLRQKAEAMRDELVRAFKSDLMADVDLRMAMGHWLQNAAALPLSLEDSDVRQFYLTHDVRREDLEAAADALNLNLAIVDDLVRLDAATATSQVGVSDPRTEEGR